MATAFQNISEALESFLFCNEEVKRKSAEEFLNQIPSADFTGGIFEYLSALNLRKPECNELAAILLKKQYIDKTENLQKIPQDILQQMTQTLESTITAERKVVYLKRVFEILVKIYTQSNSSDNLINLITKYSQTTESNIKKGLMYLIEISCEYSFDDTQLMQNSSKISSIFMHYLEDKDPLVQSLSLKSLVTFLNSIEDENNLRKFSDVFPLLISKCVNCLKADEESGLTSLTSITDLIETHPKFVKQITNDFLNLFTEILDNFISAAIRIKALTAILTLCATNNAQVRKSDVFKQKTIFSIMKLMAESSQLSLEEWTEELEDNKLSQNDAASAAEETLAKIGYELGNKFLFPLFAPLIKEAVLQNNQWNVQCAGINAIAYLAEGSKEICKQEDLQNLVLMIKQAVHNNQENPRIQYAALTAFSLLAAEYTPELQETMAKSLFRLFLKFRKYQHQTPIQSNLINNKLLQRSRRQKYTLKFQCRTYFVQNISYFLIKYYQYQLKIT
ncbi:kap beta 3 protein, putative [Ichthyophthirius multifiliis]|uniref:Kap beta 3 protein, putative n=1 Tax=Ichthyophthirius multifiliis TaxID=5932 RepID=G0R3Y0_ICHMU|nr:kap beta 3 protein, putative [Ichthyophthirius multifiliis]EGR27811.1 kap beta 3 protein, putative [Ichthyophthirius multifiliis]|eukprot:XP_004027156.1 kap beta 3 protein, putative [Ichthyophthirius multifiliis]